MKTIDVLPSSVCVREEVIRGTLPVVIDVLRATTVIVTALENGVKEIIPVLTPEEAFKKKSEAGEGVILGGERNARIITGFDYDNSPFSYMTEDVKGKTLIMTTTNGTSALKAAESAGDVYIASFLNAKDVVARLTDQEKISLVCSGTNGNYTLEDGLCAGYIIDMLMHYSDVRLTDFAIMVHAFYLQNKNDIRKAASAAKHYRVLEQKGFLKDLDYCFRKDESNIVPVYRNGVIKKQTE